MRGQTGSLIAPCAALRFVAAAGILAVTASGCSIKRVAVNGIGNSLTTGPSVFETDDDIELVGDALPFSVKLMEMLLNESPENEGLLLTAAKGYTLYAYACVQRAAEMNPANDVMKVREAAARARNLYLRAVRFGIRGIETENPGFGKALAKDPKAAVAGLRKDRVPFMYWTAAALGLAISANKGDAEMLARLPEVSALLDRGLELDEAWDSGALHEFAITFVSANPAASPDWDALKKHYDRALALSGGSRASLFVTWAESASIPRQDSAEFKAMLGKALAVDIESAPNLRLSNSIAKRRAAWLSGRTGEYFLDDGTEEEDQ